MKIAVWVLNIGNYRPDICAHTLPSIKQYADRIGGEYREITSRKFPDHPVTVEKLQVHELGLDYDINILVDADILISDQMVDVAALSAKSPNDVIVMQGFSIPRYFPYSMMFSRLPLVDSGDGKTLLGPSANFVVTNRLSHCVWRPDVSVPQLADPRRADEYVLSYNTARFGLQIKPLGNPDYGDLYHVAAASTPSDHDLDKLLEMKEFWRSIGKIGRRKKAIYTININDFQPEITGHTFPLMQQYAAKTGADFIILEDRKYPDWPIPYEKCRIHECGADYDSIMFVDADMVIHPEMPDLFDECPYDHIMVYDGFNAREIYNASRELFRDVARNQGISGNFLVSTRYTHDIWKPLDMDVNEAWGMVRPKYARVQYVLDELMLTHNCSKYNIPYFSCRHRDKLLHLGCQDAPERDVHEVITRFLGKSQ